MWWIHTATQCSSLHQGHLTQMLFRVSTCSFSASFLNGRPRVQNPFAQRPAVLPVRRNTEWQETSTLTLRPSHLTKERWNDRHKWQFKVFTDLKKKKRKENSHDIFGFTKKDKNKGEKKKKTRPPIFLSFASRNGWIIFISNFSKELAWGREQRLNTAAPWESSEYLLPV